ncbi:hypothetical protein EDB19DRAFT_1965224 [Suillus lakei]|nr:hypothetical protein EDB19DRAFT_1965224 [Suillus lakei]
MPPIPTTLDAEALSLIESIERHNNDLFETFQIPRLRACAAAEVREDIEGLARQIEELDVLPFGALDRPALSPASDSSSSLDVSICKDSRAALLASKYAIDSQSREELLRSPAIRKKSTSTSGERVTEDSDALMKANHDVTEALQRTIGLMQKEFECSVLSSQLLATYYRILIISGLMFFGLVVLFILKQRIIDRGLRIAFFWARLSPSSGSSTRAVVQEAGEVVTTALIVNAWT